MRPGFKLGACIGILAIISIAAIVAWYFQPETTTYTEGFEDDFGGWKGDADVPANPNKPGSLVDWNVSRLTYPSKSGQYTV